MGLVSPWLLFGLAALAVPVLIHLVQREEHSGRKFPSLMFVRRIPFEIKRRRKIRNPLLLALRCLALAAIVTAFAAPHFDGKVSATAASAVQRDVVILLDRSYSMGHPQRWKRAMTEAGARIAELGSGERAALVTFQDRAEVVAELGADKAALQAALDRVHPGDGRTGYAAAFAAANRMLVSSEANRHEVVLITDLQRSALDDNSMIPLGEKVELDIVAIGGPLGGNVTVTRAELAPQKQDSVEDRLLVRIENTGDALAADSGLQLLVDGRIAETRPLALAAGEARMLTLPLVLAADRPTRIAVQVGPDALPADDPYYLVLAPRRPIAVALIEPEHSRAHQGVYFEEALRLAQSPAVQLRRVRLEQVTETQLKDVDVVVLDDVPVPPGPQSDAMAAFVAGGGGLFAVAGPSVGAAWPGGNDGVLPGTPGAETAMGDAARRLVPVATDHDLWAAPGLERGKVLATTRIDAVRALAPQARDRILARLDNGAGLLLERSTGAGKALALATSVDPRWSTLALEPGFVPFVQAAVAYLAGRGGWRDAYLTGEVVDLNRVAGHLQAGSEWRRQLASGGAVVVELPSGPAERLEGSAGALFNARVPGIHEAHRLGSRGASLPFAVNVDRAESVLTAASPEELERRVVRRGRAVLAGKKGSTGADDTDPFGPARWLMILAAVALITESLMAKRISISRRPAATGVRT
jgi:hypothetical protein